MARALKVIGIGVLVAAAVLLAVDLSSECIGDGDVSVTVTVHSREPVRLRRVTYDHYGDRASVEECLRFPRENAEYFRDAWIKDGQSFSFAVPFSTHVSTLGICKNTHYWRPFAVFHIETAAGEVYYVGTEVPDVRETKAITIDIP
jgi:hypothetical protein